MITKDWKIKSEDCSKPIFRLIMCYLADEQFQAGRDDSVAVLYAGIQEPLILKLKYLVVAIFPSWYRMRLTPSHLIIVM